MGSPPAHPDESRSPEPPLLSFQKEIKENKTNQPLFLILDNGFSKVLRKHLCTFLLPGESRRWSKQSRAVDAVAPTGTRAVQGNVMKVAFRRRIPLAEHWALCPATVLGHEEMPSSRLKAPLAP